jgi:long-chain fatty acid transport protein
LEGGQKVNKTKWFALVAAWGWLILTPVSGESAGFALIDLSGARATALMSTMVARADDPSAVFYNPAGLVQLPGFQVMGGFSFVFPQTSIVTHAGGFDTSTSLVSQVFVVPHFFSSYQINDRVWLGVGINSPFGLGTKYDDGWPGRFNIIKASVQTVNINPTVAVKITEYLSVGAGLDIMYFSINLQRALPLEPLGSMTLRLGGDTWGLGFNLGVLLKPRDNLSLGISYRSQVREQVSGAAHFDPFSPLNTRASGAITLPDMVFGGIMVRPTEKLSLEAGVIWTHWSLFKSLTMNFDNILGRLSEKKNWHDTWRGQVGAEYRALPWLDLRAGYSLENEPMPDEYVDYLVPTTNLRHSFSLGTGFRWRAMTIDLAYIFVYAPDRYVNSSKAFGVLPATFQNRLTNALTVSLGYKF